MKKKVNEDFQPDNGDFDGEVYFWTDDNAYPFVYFMREGQLLFGGKGTNHLSIYCNKINGCDTKDLNQMQYVSFYNMVSQIRKQDFEGRVWNLKNRNDLQYDLLISFWDNGTHMDIAKSICERFKVEPSKCVVVDEESNGYLLSGGKPFKKTDRIMNEIKKLKLMEQKNKNEKALQEKKEIKRQFDEMLNRIKNVKL